MKKNLYRMLLIPFMLMLAVSVAQADKGGKGGGKKGGSGDGKGQPVHKRVNLTPSGDDKDASGFVMISFNGNKKKSQETLQIKVEKVAGNAAYTILVDGTM